MAASQASVQLALVTHRKGAYIMIEDKHDNDFFYIIKQGQVEVSKEIDLDGTGKAEVLKPGDFFGVVSAMSGHPRDESAIAMSDCALIAVKRDQFGVLIQKNAPLAMKIIRSFSQKLRYNSQQIAKLTLKEDVVEDAEGLYDIGEYYYNQGKKKLAMYAFVRYLQIKGQNGLNVDNVKGKLKNLGPIDQNIGKPVTDFNVVKEDGEFLFCENEPGNELYIINEGSVKITKILSGKEVLLAVLNQGDIFGEMAILDNKPRSASAIAYGHTKLMAVNKANFGSMVKAKPALATKLITLLSGRVWTTYRQLSNILLKDPVGRLFDALYTELQKNHVGIEKKKAHLFGFGLKELINMLGMDPSEGKKAGAELMKNRAFKQEGDRIYVSDLEEIKKQTEYYKKMAALEKKREAAKNR